jgi:hypothetical protein
VHQELTPVLPAPPPQPQLLKWALSRPKLRELGMELRGRTAVALDGLLRAHAAAGGGGIAAQLVERAATAARCGRALPPHSQRGVVRLPSELALVGYCCWSCRLW